MRFGLHLGYWVGGPPPGVQHLLRELVELGLESIWTSEGYGSDALTPLAWWGHEFPALRLGTNVLPLAARAPAATAMAAMTLDHLSGGRFALGLGVSGPQVVEGWYGQPFDDPLRRTREYVSVVRSVLARTAPVTSPGPYYPLPAPGGTGIGKPLRSTVRPLRPDLPLLLGAEGPRNVALAGEVADGWLAAYYAPRQEEALLAPLREGWARPGARHQDDGFEVAARVQVVVRDSLEDAVDATRRDLAFTIGAMGSREHNFHRNVFARLGFQRETELIANHYAAGRPRDAEAVVTAAMAQETGLVGTAAHVRESLEAWRGSRVDTLILAGDPESLRVVAALLG